MPAPIPHLILIGPRAAGKSTFGALVARKLHRPLVDLDELVRERFDNATIADIFSSHGQAAFREAELDVLRDVLDRAPSIIALGGGAPMTPAARARLADARLAGRAFIIYLSAPADVLQERLRSADLSGRPSLTGRDPIDEVPEVIAERGPTYTSLADHTIDTHGRDVDEIVERLAAYVS